MKNISLARDRIVKALKDNEKILIHADCDSDGLNSGALLYNFLTNFTDTVSYTHSQRSIGHGIQNSVDDIPDDTQLLIILDSSSNEVEACRQLVERGIDIIILDHHLVNVNNEYCILINPQQEGCDYPNKNISGSVVTWKMCQILDIHLGTYYSEDLIDLAAFGLYSDVLPMNVYENRYIVMQGLSKIKNLGIMSLLKVIKKDKELLTTTTIGYSLSPMINAAARMNKLELILELFTCKDSKEALKIAKQVHELNEERKEIQEVALKRIIPNIDENKNCIIVIDSDLGKGFNGLIAGDLVKTYGRPAIVLGEVNDEFHGSFRAPDELEFIKILEKMPYVFDVGGHGSAGGLKIKQNDLEKFEKAICEKLCGQVDNSLFYDLEISAKDINQQMIEQIQEMYRISGHGFPEARFLIKDVFVLSKQTLGKSGNTLKSECCSGSEVWIDDEDLISQIEPSFVLMKFRTDSDYIESFPLYKSIDVIGTLNVNTFTYWKPKYRVVKTNQIFIEDYKINN